MGVMRAISPSRDVLMLPVRERPVPPRSGRGGIGPVSRTGWLEARASIQARAHPVE